MYRPTATTSADRFSDSWNMLAIWLFATSAMLPGAPQPVQIGARSVAAALRSAVHDARAPLLAGLLAGMLSTTPAFAVGSQDMTIGLTYKSYAEVTCPEALRQGRAGGALGAGAGGAGIAQKCVEVQATASNTLGKEVKDAGVFGVVNEAARLGAVGYVLKHSPKAEVLAARRDVLDSLEEDADEENG